MSPAPPKKRKKSILGPRLCVLNFFWVELCLFWQLRFKFASGNLPQEETRPFRLRKHSVVAIFLGIYLLKEETLSTIYCYMKITCFQNIHVFMFFLSIPPHVPVLDEGAVNLEIWTFIQPRDQPRVRLRVMSVFFEDCFYHESNRHNNTAAAVGSMDKRKVVLID